MQEILAMKKTNQETGLEEADYERQEARLKELVNTARMENKAAIAATNERYNGKKTIYARPVAGLVVEDWDSKGLDAPIHRVTQGYDAYVHGDHPPEELPKDWDAILLSPDLYGQKCMICGYPLKDQLDAL